MGMSHLPYRPCVGTMVLNDRGLVWIGRRVGSADQNEGRGNWWQMPQGGIDEGEELAEAALRELREETGIHSVEILAESSEWYCYDLPPEVQPASWGGRYRGQKQKWFAVRFTGSDEEVSLTPAGDHKVEFDAWRWARIEELPGLIVPFKRPVYEALVKEFARFAHPTPGS